MKHTDFENNNGHRISSFHSFPVKFRLKTFIPVIVGLTFFYLLFNTGCANVGTPSGGPKDSIPPVVVKTVPQLKAKNFTDKKIELTFDEFIISDAVSENLVVSPPLKKKPQIKTKGKTLIVEFQEDLKPSTTYSLDFKDAVADNNEKNPLKNLRFSFSTGNSVDTLRVSGYVKNALTQEPVEKALVVLHHQKDYKAFKDTIPDYIGTTNKEGFFMIDNVAKGSYKLYALTDADNSLTYNSGAESIAFDDSLIVPSVKYVAKADTLITGADTLVVKGHSDYLPSDQYLMMFDEVRLDQSLSSYNRSQANRCNFYFAESLSDSFKVKLLKPHPVKPWSYIESNLKRDSITVWLTDTIFSKTDSLLFELRYQTLDSLHHQYVKRDTLHLVYTPPKAPKAKHKKGEHISAPTIDLKTNINASAQDFFQRIVIEAQEPLANFDTTKVGLFAFEDTIKTKIPAKIVKDSLSVRKYYLDQLWNPSSSYVLEIDSAAVFNIYGYPNKKIEQKFKTQKEEYYGKITLNISGLTDPAIIQLIGSDKEEKVLQKFQILKDGKVEIPYLKPAKYKLKLICDKNRNGKWDTGDLAKNIQPERVIYYPKVIKIKSNFEFVENWEVKYKPEYKKNLVDEDAEKDKAKKKNQKKDDRGY